MKKSYYSINLNISGHAVNINSIFVLFYSLQHFRDQCIDGSGLPLLTEDHLVNSLGMKLGPTLKLRSILAKKLGGPCPCVSCVAQVQQVLALQTSGITAAAVSKTAALTNPATTSEHLRGGGIETDKATIGSSSGSSSCCNSHLPKNTFSINSNINCNSSNSNNSSSSSHVNKNESTTTITTTTSNTNAIATNSNTTNVCNSEDNTDARSNCNINIGNFSPNQQSHNNCNSSSNNNNSNNNNSSNNNNNATNNRHDNADSSS